MKLYESDHTKFMRELFEKIRNWRRIRKRRAPSGGIKSWTWKSASASRNQAYRRRPTSISENRVGIRVGLRVCCAT